MGVQPVGGAWTPSNYAGGGSGTAYPLNLDAMLAVVQRMGQCFNPHETGVLAAPVSNDRIDRVVVDDTTGAVSVLTGTESATPTPPLIPPGKRPVAQILLHTSTTAITNTTNIT